MAPRFDFAALYEALERRRISRGLSWNQVAQEIGGTPRNGHRISTSTIVRTSRGGPMEADGVLAMVRWLGLRFSDFTTGPSSSRRHSGFPRVRKGRFHARAFYEAINEKRVKEGKTWKQLSAEIAGFSPGMLTRLAKGGRLEANQVVMLSDWLGKEPEDFTHTPT